MLNPHGTLLGIVLNNIYEKTVLITGFTGFIGNHLYLYLNKYYPTYRIVCISRQKTTHKDTYCIDLLDKKIVNDFIGFLKPDYIFHLAGIVFSFDLEELYSGNVLTTMNLLEAIKNNKLNTHVVITGSAAEYGIVSKEYLPVVETYNSRPQTPYGISKFYQTTLAKYYQDLGVRVSIAKVFNVIGYGVSSKLIIGDLLFQMIQAIKIQKPSCIFVGNLEIKRDFLDIADVCSGLIAIAHTNHVGDEYNLCSGYSVSFQEIINELIIMSKINIEVVVDKIKPQNSYIEDIYGCNMKLKVATDWNQKITLTESLQKVLTSKDSPSIN